MHRERRVPCADCPVSSATTVTPGPSGPPTRSGRDRRNHSPRYRYFATSASSRGSRPRVSRLPPALRPPPRGLRVRARPVEYSVPVLPQAPSRSCRERSRHAVCRRFLRRWRASFIAQPSFFSANQADHKSGRPDTLSALLTPARRGISRLSSHFGQTQRVRNSTGRVSAS